MKTRQSLVSNSSSCSFIVHAPIQQVAKQMYELFLESMCGEGEFDKCPTCGKMTIPTTREKFSEDIKKLENALDMTNVQNGSLGICLPSVMDTFIIFNDNRCYVQTDKNYMWDELDDVAFYEADGIVKSQIEDKWFFHVDNGKIIKRCWYKPEDGYRIVCSKCGKMDGWNYYFKDDDDNKICELCFSLITIEKIEERLDES